MTPDILKERPILFSGPMVRAILEGRKTQTRRVMKPQPDGPVDLADFHKSRPFGQAGDRLWVRETWGVGCRPCPREGWRDGIEFRADEAYLDDHDDLPLYGYDIDDVPEDFCFDCKPGWHPSIHMHKWMTRLWLEVKAVRVERLQDISLTDVRAEGVDLGRALWGVPIIKHHAIAASEFADLWNSLNEKRGYGWDANPWVWVIEFERANNEKGQTDE